MGKKLTKRERRKSEQRKVATSLKATRMKRGDKGQEKYQANMPESIEKPISGARAKRLALKNLTPERLESLVGDKCLYSNIYSKEGVEVSEVEFNYDGFKSDYGLKLAFNNSNLEKEHYFGFELSGDKIRIHYAEIRSDGSNPWNDIMDINPKKLSARKLLNMIGESR